MCLYYFAKRRTALQSVQKVEHQAPYRGNRFTTKQRDRESKRDKHIHRQNNQEKRARENNETDTDKQQHNKRTRQDKRTTDY